VEISESSIDLQRDLQRDLQGSPEISRDLQGSPRLISIEVMVFM